MLYTLIGIPIILYLGYIIKYAVNVPRQDDYDAILGFLIQYKQTPGDDKLALLFGQHNEHRIFSSRLVYALYYQLTGSINFRHLIFIDAVWLVGLFLVMAGFIRRIVPQQWPIGVLVLSMCLFDLNNYENMNFAMAGMQNFAILLLFSGAMWGYGTQKTGGIAIGALLQAMAVFSSGNGLLGAFFLVLYTILMRHKAGIITSVAVSVIAISLYYVNYQKVGGNFFTSDPQKFIPYFMHCLGAHFNKELGVVAAVLMLLAMLLLIPVQRWLRFDRATLPLVITLGFLVASVGVIALFRGNLPLDTAYSSRYFIYSHLITTILFVLYLYKYRNKDVRVATGAIMALMLFVAIRNYNDGSKMLPGFSYVTSTSDFDYPDKERAKKITEEACNMSIYCIDQHRIKIQ